MNQNCNYAAIHFYIFFKTTVCEYNMVYNMVYKNLVLQYGNLVYNIAYMIRTSVIKKLI